MDKPDSLKDSLLAALTHVFPLAQQLIDQKQRRDPALRGCIEHAIALRLDAPSLPPGEEPRLRCLLGLLPHLAGPALTYALGMVRVDGRPGDYVTPPNECGQDADAPEPCRLARAVRMALAAVELFTSETSFLFVPRPAVSLATEALKQRGFEVVVHAQAKPNDDPWMVRDLVVVTPASRPTEA